MNGQSKHRKPADVNAAFGRTAALVRRALRLRAYRFMLACVVLGPRWVFRFALIVVVVEIRVLALLVCIATCAPDGQ